MTSRSDLDAVPQQSSSVLDGIRVLEVGGYVTAPYAAMALADLGADVIKVEQPGRGDPFRGWGAGLYSPTFVALNRNKRSVELDLRTEWGRETLGTLARDADVAIVNVRPSSRSSMGVSSGQLCAENQRLVYCSITGFGEDGPYADRPGYDTIGQATSGLLGMLVDAEDGKPPGVSVSDHLTGLTAAQAILAALFHRERTGRGQVVRTSLLEASLSFIGENAARHLSSGEVPRRRHRTALAQVYSLACRGGAPVVIHLSSPPKFWHGLTAALGLDDLAADPVLDDRAGRVDGYDRIRARVQEAVGELDRAEVLEALHRHGVPAAPVNGLDEVLADEQVQHLAMTWELGRGPEGEPIRAVRAGYRLEIGDPAPRRPPPTLGEHSREVFAAAGVEPLGEPS